MMLWMGRNGISVTTADLYHDADLKLDIEDTKLPEASYDLIVCNHVLEHVNDYRRALKEVYRILVPGGSLLCSFPMDPNIEYVDEDPDVKTDTHYDVPKGTKVIGAHAFDSDRMLNPLKTISLPLGLERIEGMAFSGCGRLQSLTVPLTVKYVSPNAFYNCVSLERLSLPQGITVDGIGSWAESGDTDRYNGDNGLTEVGNGYGGTAGYEAYIDPADGSNAARCVTGSNEPVSLPAGTIVRVMTNEAGRSVIYCDAVGGLCRVDSGDLQPMTGLAYFDVTDMRIEPGTLHPVDGSVLDPAEWRANIWQEAGTLTECSFENGDEWIELPAYSVRFYTDARQDGRVFGMLATAPGELAVRIYDRPGGSQVARAYPLTECEILEEGNGVVRIRTPLAEGWVYSDQVRIAEVQEKE